MSQPNLCPGHQDAVQAAPGLQACVWHRQHTADVLAVLPDVWATLGEPRWPSMVPTQGGSGETSQPISDARRQARTAISALLVSWVLILVDADRASIPNDLGDRQVTWCCQTITTHLDWLLAHPEHADQLLHDLEDAGSWRAMAEPDPPSLTIECACSRRVRVEADELMRCSGCGAWGTLEWWIEQVQGRPADSPVTLREAVDVLLARHGHDVPLPTLRTWARWRRDPDDPDVEPTPPRLLPVPWVAVPGDLAARYDMLTIVAQADAMKARRRTARIR